MFLKDAFQIDNRVYLCMQMVEGSDLLSYIPDKGLPDDVAKDIFYQICLAITYCHSSNVCFFFFFFLSFFSFSFPFLFFFFFFFNNCSLGYSWRP